MKLPKITNQQQAILRLIYRHRYLNRIQIQILMHHTDKRRIIAWLKDLREKQYIEWIYDSKDFVNKSKPAIYYLGLNGIRHLRELEEYPTTELRKRYKESARTQAFIDKCILLADCCINLQSKSTNNLEYSYVTEPDYTDPDDEYSFLSELRPHLCFVKHKTTKKAAIVTYYLLEVFDAATPRYMVKKRLRDYVEYLDSGEWEAATGDSASPTVLFVFSSIAELVYAKRRMYTLLEDTDGADTIHILFATLENIKRYGVTGLIWAKA